MFSTDLNKHIAILAQPFPITKILLFGSRAYGDHNERSDIDLAVIAPDITADDWISFTDILEEHLETLLKLDIINWSEASEKLKEEINKCHVVLYERQIGSNTLT